MTPPVLAVAFVASSMSAYAVASGPAALQGTGYLALHAALTIVMLLAWRSDSAGSGWILGAGVVARVLLIGVPPFTTHDVERYVWDGAVTLAGYDPYRLAPAAPALAHLRDVWPTSAAHVDFTTVYPPAALALFALAASAGPDAAMLAWKTLAGVASVLTLFVAAALLRRRGMEHHLPLVAFSPLLVLEGGVGAHLDAFTALGLVAALWAIERRRPIAAGAALACGALVKFLPAVAVLPIAVALGRRGGAFLVLSAVVVGVAGYALAGALGLSAVGGLGAFFAYARFGSPVAAVLEGLAGVNGLLLGGMVVALVLGAAAVVLAARNRLDAGLQCALAAPLVVSPVVYPWYLSPLLVSAALAPSAVVLLWATTLPLTYEVLNELGASGRWVPARWPLVVVAVGWLVGGVLATARASRAA